MSTATPGTRDAAARATWVRELRNEATLLRGL